MESVMALRNYMEAYQVSKRKLFVTVCIYEKPGYRTNSPVNRMLEELLAKLKAESEDYEEIRIAYVYETENLMDVREFSPLTPNSPVLYKEPCGWMNSHKLHQVFFMGLTLLEQKLQQEEAAESRLYLLTDEKFERVNQIVCQTPQGVEINPGIRKGDTKVILIKSCNAGDELFEKYIADETQIVSV